MSLLIYINLKTCNRNLRKYFLCLSSDGNILVFFLWFRMNYKEVIFAYDTTKRSNSVSNVSRLVDARIMKNLDLDDVDTKSRKMSRRHLYFSKGISMIMMNELRSFGSSPFGPQMYSRRILWKKNENQMKTQSMQCFC